MFDPSKKFVRVTQLREDGFVEFDFAIGEADVYVEMILPASAFDEFCALNKVLFLDESATVCFDDAHTAAFWRLGNVNPRAKQKTGGKGRS